MRETRDRVREQISCANRQEPGTRPARVAIVGAGPIGLWIAVLLAREHAKIVETTGAPRITKLPSAPKLDLFERRGGSSSEAYGVRRIVLAISSATQDLLNKHLLSDRGLSSDHVFSPTCSINFIENVLRENFERYVSAGLGSFRCGEEVQDPEALLAQGLYDVVIVAAGRQALSEPWRRFRGMELSTGSVEKALIMKFTCSPLSPRTKARGGIGHMAESNLARAVGGGRIFIRPGASEEQGYAWMLGLPADLADRVQFKLAGQRREFASFAALGEELEAGSRVSAGIANSEDTSLSWPATALCLLDEMLSPVTISARLTVASYWHSATVAHRVEAESGAPEYSVGGWIVLAGDAACGRPFYLGSTLNGHFHDVVPLIHGSQWSQWDPEGMPFRKYADRYKVRVAAVGYHRP